MAGLYQRGVTPNLSSPGMRVDASRGSGGAVPRGAGLLQRQSQGMDASKLGGLLGMLGKGQSGQGEGVFNEGVMPGVGRSMASPVNSQAKNTAAMMQGSNVDVASNMAAGAAANLPQPTLAGNFGPGISATGGNVGSAASGMNLNFDPSKLGGLLGSFNFGG